MARAGILSCVLLLYCFTGTSSLKCNMCIGSTTSDCAKNVQSSMVIQTCIDMTKFGRGPPPGWQPRDGSTTPVPPLPSEEENDAEEIDTADAAIGDVDNSDYEDMNSTDDRPHHHHHHHHHGPHHHHHHRRPKLDALCAYVKLKAESNSTGFVDRACVYIPKKFDLCTYLKDHLKNMDACKTCDKDQCN